jgi:hypothetical protein
MIAASSLSTPAVSKVNGSLRRRAPEVAESVGALTSAGQALLTLIEEHGRRGNSPGRSLRGLPEGGQASQGHTGRGRRSALKGVRPRRHAAALRHALSRKGLQPLRGASGLRGEADRAGARRIGRERDEGGEAALPHSPDAYFDTEHPAQGACREA